MTGSFGCNAPHLGLGLEGGWQPQPLRVFSCFCKNMLEHLTYIYIYDLYIYMLALKLQSEYIEVGRFHSTSISRIQNSSVWSCRAFRLYFFKRVGQESFAREKTENGIREKIHQEHHSGQMILTKLLVIVKESPPKCQKHSAFRNYTKNAQNH